MPILVPSARRSILWGITPEMDSDALAYIRRVEAADGQSLERGARSALNELIRGCKLDPSLAPGVSNYEAIKSSCILSCARTLAGALIPLRGPSPQSVNFTNLDYNRITGLKGGGVGSGKRLNTNYSNASAPQNSSHLSCFITEVPSGDQILLQSGASGTDAIATGGGPILVFASRRTGSANSGSYTSALNNTFVGVTRANSTQMIYRRGGVSTTISSASVAPDSANIGVYDRVTGSPNVSSARLSFFSGGETVDLERLDARLSTFMAAIAARLSA